MAPSGTRLTSAGAFFDAMQSEDQKPTISVYMVPDNNNQGAQSSSSMLGDEEIINPAAAVDENFLAPPPANFSQAVPHSPVLGCVNDFLDSASFDQCLLQPPSSFAKQQDFIGFDANCMNDLFDGDGSDLELQCFDNWEELFPTLLV